MPGIDEQMIVRTTVRFDEDVYEALTKWADDHDRSMNYAVNGLLRVALVAASDAPLEYLAAMQRPVA